MDRAPGSPLPAVERPLRGRDDEVRLIDRALAEAATGAAANLVLTGAPGQGKTALLAEARRRAQAAGFLVVPVVGHEVHRDLAFVGLHALVRPLRHLLTDLPERPAAVLRVVLGLDDEQVAPLAVANATLALLARAAEHQALLVAVDDVQWVDPSSLATLLFVAHQVQVERLALIFACRPDGSHRLARAGLPGIGLDDLDDASAEQLLLDRAAPPAVARRCHELAGGNPLAILEGFAALTPAQRSGTAELPAALPMGDRLLGHYRARLITLPAATRTALAVAAVDTSGEVATVVRAIAHLGGTVEDLVVAETEGIVEVDRNRLAWRHPLLRAAVQLTTAPRARRDAHRALAAAMPAAGSEEQRLWHRARAVVGQDEAVAAGLVAVAERAARRGDLPAAAAATAQAAELTPDEATAEQRRLVAANYHWIAGDPGPAAVELRPLFERGTDPDRLGQAAELLGQVENALEGPRIALPRFTHYAAELRHSAPRRAALLHLRAALAWLIRLDADHAEAEITRAAEVADESGDGLAALAVGAVRVVMATFTGPVPDVAAQVDALEQLLGLAVGGMDNALAQLGAYALMTHDRYETAQRILLELTRQADSSGMPGMGVLARAYRAEALWRQGRWSDALAEISVAATVQRATGMRVMNPAVDAMAARVLAGLGRVDECLARVDAAVGEGGLLDHDLAVTWARSAAGLVLLGEGRADEATAALDEVEARAGHLRQPGWLWWQGDRIEALHASGRAAEARAALATLARTAPAGRGPCWARGVVLRSRAILHLGDIAADHTAAIAVFTEIGAPFERARTLLARGSHHLGAGEPSVGYRDLAEARMIFDRLGARSWSARASAGRGEHAGPDLSLAARLTEKELPVALMVGGGATDRETADRLFISTKTVSYHLGNIYRSLGLRNRSQLAALVAAERATGGDR